MSRKNIWHISMFLCLLLLALGFIPWQFPNLIMQQGGTVVQDSLKIYDEASKTFIPFQTSKYPGTLAEQTYHFQLDLTAKESALLLEIEKPQLASVHMVQTSANGSILKEAYLGRDYIYQSQDIHYRNLVTSLVKTGQPSQLDFYVTTNTYLQMPLVLWEPDAFHNHVYQVQLLSGLFYGMILIMAFYSLLLGIFLRDKPYFFYFALLLSYLLLQMVWDGTAYQYLWPNQALWDRIANPFFINASSLFLLLFTSHFLKCNQRSKLLSFAYIGTVCYHLAVFFAVLGITSNVTLYLAMISVVLSFFYIFFSFLAGKHFFSSQIIFFMALLFFLTGNLLNLFAGIKLMPYSVYTMLAPKAGTIFMIVFFSLALGNRIRDTERLKGIEAEKARLLKELHELNQTIIASKDIKKVAQDVLTTFLSLSEKKEGCLLLFDQNDLSQIYCYYSTGFVLPKSLTEEELSALIEYLHTDSLLHLSADKVPYLEMNHSQSLFLLPLINFNLPIGVLILSSEAEESKELYKTSLRMNLLKDYAPQIAIIIGNINAFDEIYLNARTDELTQIYNRRVIFEILNNYYHPHYKAFPLSVLMIDIDHFKHVNDAHGHSIGDQILRMVAHHIKAIIEDIGEVGRYGGEEFIVLLPFISMDKAEAIAEELRASISQLTYIAETKAKIQITISIGVSFTKDAGVDPHTLCNKADQGLYQAKETGRNKVVAYII